MLELSSVVVAWLLGHNRHSETIPGHSPKDVTRLGPLKGKKCSRGFGPSKDTEMRHGSISLNFVTGVGN